ncbi:MAG: aldolase, partial [Gemmatimonas sp.]
IGPFKKRLWALPADVRAKLGVTYDAKFEFLFRQLGIGGTRDIVAKFVTMTELHRIMPTDGTPAMMAAPDDADLSD